MVEHVPILHPGGVVTRDQQQQLIDMERTILDAISAAKAAGVPQGLIVAVVHAQATIQTDQLIGRGTGV
jgi:hypothetical protein